MRQTEGRLPRQRQTDAGKHKLAFQTKTGRRGKKYIQTQNQVNKHRHLEENTNGVLKIDGDKNRL